MPVFNLKFPHTLMLIAFLSCISMAMQMAAQLEIFSYIRNPLVTWCNIIPIFLLMLILYLVTNRAWAAYISVGAVHLLMLAVNHYKLYFLSEPFRPIDIMLATEALNITQNYTIAVHIEIVLALLIFVGGAIWVCTKVKCEKTPLKFRILLLLLAVVLAFVSYKTIYANKDFYDGIYISESKKFNDGEVIREKGFIYSFLINMNSGTYPPPDGYDSTAAAEKAASYTAGEGKMPNVIAVMSEAFFDPQVGENVKFKINPLKDYNELKKEAYYGGLIVPGFAGSTASTEFEFLTGMNISLIDRKMPVVYKTHVTKDMYALPRFFGGRGYATSAIHPGHEWFYNRRSVYNRMGFDSELFYEDLDFKPETVNYYTADSETTKLIIDDYKKHLSENPDKGYFNFTVTIQNHGPYIDDELGDEVFIERPDGVSDELYYTLNNYMRGVRDAAKLLCDLKEFSETLSEPTVIVFFGDHLPFFDSEQKGLSALGYDVSADTADGVKRRYTTPYLICSNSAAKDMIKAQGGKVLSGYGGDISSNYLASVLFKYMNVNPGGFFAFTDEAREQAEIISPHFIVSGGEMTDEQSVSALLDDYRKLQYYFMREYTKQ